LADRYTGRHIRQARHGAWRNERRSRFGPSGQLLPAAAALTVAGILISGAGIVIQLAPQASNAESVASYDAANYPPPDRDAVGQHASRDGRVAGATAAPTQKPPSGAAEAVTSTGSCEASYYDEPQMTADGETFDPEALTAANKNLPFNSRVRVTNLANGKSVVVRINDRGPYVNGRCLDLSRAAFRSIASLGLGVVNVRYEVLAKSTT
jgi:rare lipoprotein A